MLEDSLPFPQHPASRSLSRHVRGLTLLLLTLAAPAHAANLSSPYWYVDESTTARLYVTNNGDATSTVTPILLFSSGGEDVRLTLSAIGVAPEEVVTVDINSAVAGSVAATEGSYPRWGDGSRRNSLTGAAELQGSDLTGITAQIVSESQAESLSVGSLFQAAEWGFIRLGQLWWAPGPTTRVIFALQNLSTTTIRLSATVVGPAGGFTPATVVVSPRGRKLVDLETLLPGVSPLPEYGFVSFALDEPTDADVPPEFLGRTILIDETTGLSSSAAMDNPDILVSTRVQIPAVMTGAANSAHGYPAETQFESKLILANTSASTVTFTPTVSWQGPFGAEEVVLGTRSIAPNSVQFLDVRDDLLAANPEVPESMLNLRIDHDAAPGTFFAEISTVDATRSIAMKCPLVDVATAGVQKVAVRFDLDGQRNTVLTAVNSFDLPVDYVFALSYRVAGQPARYESQTFTLGPQEIAVVDVRALRDGAVPDRHGNTLPLGLTSGSASLIAAEAVLLSIDATADPVSRSVILCEEMCHRLHPRLRALLCGAAVPEQPEPETINLRTYRVDPAFHQGGCFRRFDGWYTCRYIACQQLPQCGNQPGIAVSSFPALGGQASWLRVRIFWFNTCFLLWFNPLPYNPC